MSKSDKTKLDNAVSTDTASRLVIRDSAGRARVKNPSSAQDIATKSYVDSTSSSAASSAVSGIPLATSSSNGLMKSDDKELLDSGTTVGKSVFSAVSAAVGRSALGLNTGAVSTAGTAAELNTGTSTANRVWQPKIIADYIKSAISALSDIYEPKERD